MIRIFVLTGIIGGMAIAYLSVFALGPTAQLPPPESLLVGYREDGYVPQNLNLPDDHAAEDLGAFEVPEEDAVALAAVIEAMGEMPGMDMGAGGEAMEGMEMAANDAAPEMEEGMEMPANEDGAAMEGMNMSEAADPAADNMAEMAMSPSSGALMGEGGLLITSDGDFDREIDLSMNEWSFSDMDIEVVKGERIRFNITNDGEILHEFMIMEMAAMQAVGYRVNRADWSLLEHEALYEKALVLPDGDFSFILEVQEDGAWMFMCMLPYHMEMGMMGQMATAGNAMTM